MKRSFNARCALLALAGLFLTVSLCLAQERQNQERRGPGGSGGGFGFGGPGGGFMGFGGQDGVGGMLRLLTNPAVQEDLELPQKRINPIKKINDAYQEDVRKGMGNFNFQELRDLTEEERVKAMAKFRDKMAAQGKKLNKKYHPKLDKLVGEADFDRIKQIQRQLAGVMALRNMDVVEELGLSEDQQKQIDSVFAASQEEMQKLFPRGGFGGPGGRGGAGRGAGDAGEKDLEADATERRERFQKMQEQMRELNEDRDEKLMAVLTDEQQTKFEELKGEPFDRSKLLPPGFGGPGGPGAPGGRPASPRLRPEM
jgi:hypothetical protein